MANQHRVVQIASFQHGVQIVGESVVVVAAGRHARTSVAATVIRHAAMAFEVEEQHLIVPHICMTKYAVISMTYDSRCRWVYIRSTFSGGLPLALPLDYFILEPCLAVGAKGTRLWEESLLLPLLQRRPCNRYEVEYLALRKHLAQPSVVGGSTHAATRSPSL
jgi:hypothetical protein